MRIGNSEAAWPRDGGYRCRVILSEAKEAMLGMAPFTSFRVTFGGSE